MSSSVVLAPTRPFRVALELRSRPAHSDYWIELTSPHESSGPLDLVAEPPTVVRITATDLREAQRIRHGIRADLIGSGRDPESVTVLLDIETIVAETAADARGRLAEVESDPRTRRRNGSISYIGTTSGLVGLIADIRTAEVADGVTIRPLELPGSLDLIVQQVVPGLGQRGVAVGADVNSDVLRALRAS